MYSYVWKGVITFRYAKEINVIFCVETSKQVPTRVRKFDNSHLLWTRTVSNNVLA